MFVHSLDFNFSMNLKAAGRKKDGSGPRVCHACSRVYYLWPKCHNVYSMELLKTDKGLRQSQNFMAFCFCFIANVLDFQYHEHIKCLSL